MKCRQRASINLQHRLSSIDKIDQQVHECHKGLALHLLLLVYNQLLQLLPVQYSMSKISSSYIQGFKIDNKFENDGHQDGSKMVSERR